MTSELEKKKSNECRSMVDDARTVNTHMSTIHKCINTTYWCSSWLVDACCAYKKNGGQSKSISTSVRFALTFFVCSARPENRSAEAWSPFLSANHYRWQIQSNVQYSSSRRRVSIDPNGNPHSSNGFRLSRMIRLNYLGIVIFESCLRVWAVDQKKRSIF